MIQGIAQSGLTRVFRRIESILKADATLSRAVQEWQTFTARDGSNSVQPARGRMAVTLFPVWGEQRWATVESHLMTLVVQVGIKCDATDIGDYLDAWYAIVRALYPADRDARLAIEKALRDEGAETGQATFQAPTLESTTFGENRQVAAIGAIALKVRIRLDP